MPDDGVSIAHLQNCNERLVSIRPTNNVHNTRDNSTK